MKTVRFFFMAGTILGILGLIMFVVASFPEVSEDHTRMMTAIGLAVFDWSAAVVFYAIGDNIERRRLEKIEEVKIE